MEEIELTDELVDKQELLYLDWLKNGRKGDVPESVGQFLLALWDLMEPYGIKVREFIKANSMCQPEDIMPKSDWFTLLKCCNSLVRFKKAFLEEEDYEGVEVLLELCAVGLKEIEGRDCKIVEA